MERKVFSVQNNVKRQMHVSHLLAKYEINTNHWILVLCLNSRKTQGHLTLKKKPHQNARTIKFTEFMTISYALHKRHFSLMYRRQILAIKQLDMPNSKYEKFILVVSTLRKSTFFRMTHTRYPLITCTTENFPSEWRKKVYWVICIFSLSLYTDRLFENWSVVTAHPLNMHCMDEV